MMVAEDLVIVSLKVMGVVKQGCRTVLGAESGNDWLVLGVV